MKRIVYTLGITGLLLANTALAQRPSSSGKARTSTETTEDSKESKENILSPNGFAGIGTLTPTAPLEIRRGAGNTRNKNIMLKLTNDWASSGQNEPSIMFFNGDYSNPKNASWWTIGARVSGDNTIKTPQTFKISFKGGADPTEKEYFSIDSYEGHVKIGDVNTLVDGYKLFVEQGILTEKVKVAIKNSKDWFDHVFDKKYNLMPLNQLEKYIQTNKHLPDIQSTAEVMKDGLDLGKMNGLLLKKVEELTLYTIQLQKEVDALKKEVQKSKSPKDRRP
ncbi:MAG: hypothetical protein K2X37_01595 [Chitinophagaceae bacterium]|nr:hypothetical protein [Chitinophagaceae bacterium]